MLKSVIETVLREYPQANKEDFKNHPFASYMRNDIAPFLTRYLNLPEIYKIQSSAGNGAWATIPWIAVFNNLVTDSVRVGFFTAYLFCADFSGVYLSLLQGTDSKKKMYGLGVSREILRKQAKVFRRMISNDFQLALHEDIDLKLDTIPKETTARRLGQAYEAGHILSLYYSQVNLPSSEKMYADILSFIKIYEELVEHKISDNQELDSVSEEFWSEDLTKYRIHRQVERNQSLSKRAKEIHGYICKACQFDFEAHYGTIGHHYIEAHHIVPISSLSKTKVQLDPCKDFTVLCSNCHRMIHRIKPTPTLEQFKKLINIE
ncbi:DUF3578 domain-containing protein [Laspinema sp. D1]|uniref:DUF3578 domain-containing protein n=1 Tax=Laspinema palackyanum D2a TaxID=2953684 RepID=A0ABT2N0H2_9CYAN|nr:DUF3578 domain-containing protein [Laspinema sp. D2a]